MAKKKQPRKKRGFTLPIAAISGVIMSLFGPIEAVVANQPLVALQRLGRNFTGYDPVKREFHPYWMIDGWVPLLLGVGGSVAASKLGLNRKLGSSGIPIIRI